MWTEMVAHWGERIEFYTSKVTKFWNTTKPRKGEFEAELEGGAEQLKTFSKEWERAEELAGYAATLKQHQADEEALGEFYYFRKDNSKADFPKLNKLIGFTKFIYHMEMLGMLQSMWNAFLEFRRYKGQNKINFMIVERCTGSKLPKEDILGTFEDWKERNPNIDVSAAVSKSKRALGDMKTPPELYFHCELQIRLVFHNLGEGHDFIGCSKLSCEVCWRILKGGIHTTRGSHHKLSTNCAFPFPNNLTDVAATMKELQDEYHDKILKNDWKEYPRLVDTLPGQTEDLVDKVCHRYFVAVHRLIV
jgi:hypothetical protein